MNKRFSGKKHAAGAPGGWRRWVSLGLSLLLAAPVLAREFIAIHSTAAQVRGADATIDQANPGTNSGGAATLTVRSGSGNSNQRSIVQFDLSVLPNVAIKQALLIMHATSSTNAGFPRTYGAFGLTSFFREADVTWNTRVASLNWTASGGDFGGTATSTASVAGGISSSTPVQFDITSDVRNWYNGTPNYGTLIKDQTEGSANTPTTTFGSRNGTAADAPELDVTFIQNVTNIAAVPGDGTVTVSWGYPVPIGRVNFAEDYTGVLILRRANFPVDKASVPTDTTDPAMCSVVGSGTVVFDNTSLATSFTDNSSDPCGAPTNDTTWFYKVFLRDQKNYYATQPIANGSVYTAEISARPSATVTNRENSVWIAATFSTTLAAPSLFPGTIVMAGSQTNLSFGIDAVSGMRKYPAVSLGGPVTGRSPVIDAADSSLAANVMYVADNDGLVYAIATDTGQILWAVNPTGLGTNGFVGAPAVQVKSFSDGTFTPTHDLLVLGTRNTGSTSANRIVGMDGNTGATLWQTIGNSGGVPRMDIINSTPAIDFVNHAVWVTSRSNGGTTRPSLWKLNPNTGAVITTAALGDTDADPTLSIPGDVLFVGNNAGTIFAIDPTTAATLKSVAGGDGAIISFPIVLGLSSPYTVIFSGQTAVHAMTYNKSANTFTTLWSTAISGPSAPISYTGASKVYVGSADGKIHELDALTGVDGKQRTANTGQPGIVGDPALDLTLSRIYISTNDQRAYGFAFPF
ncbi:MAG TPA: DNRLRE domain-containing protein [Candidatus Acidoferrum sp.]|nr:DNRLRE domain-containing protein [Candidatus Acidoferrum sp.]